MSIYESLLVDSVDIQTRSGSTNDWGEETYSWSDAHTSVDCKVMMVTDEEQKKEVGQFEDIKYKIYFKNTQDVNVEDRIIYDGNTYEVVKVFESSYIVSEDNKIKRALVKEL